LSGIKRFLFRHVVRKWMNSNVSRIRRGEWCSDRARGASQTGTARHRPTTGS
jgi:hypothetical protein